MLPVIKTSWEGGPCVALVVPGFECQVFHIGNELISAEDIGDGYPVVTSARIKDTLYLQVDGVCLIVSRVGEGQYTWQAIDIELDIELDGDWFTATDLTEAGMIAEREWALVC